VVGKGANPVAHKPINYVFNPFCVERPSGVSDPYGILGTLCDPVTSRFPDLSVDG
jgi:hypothetical protein